jgi:DNA polymerase III delta prime subunit
MQDRLFSEKYRPKTVTKMVLLPRIREVVAAPDGGVRLPTNLLLASVMPGTGKTTLASIIEASFDTMRINASLESSVDNLKGAVQEFCQTMNVFSDHADATKVVFLDEIDGVSRQFQEGLRGFIEEYEQRVRFIGTCNNISKITEALQSRFTVLDFAPKNQAETDLLRMGYVRRLTAVAKAEGMEVSPELVTGLVNASFPDFRSAFNKLQIIHARGPEAAADEVGGLADAASLYALATGPTDPEATYNYVLATWGDKVDGLVGLLGRPFAKWIFANAPEKAFKVVELLPLVRDYEIYLSQATDPAMHAMALIYQVQELYKK